MTGTNETFKRAKPRQKTAPAKRVVLSAEDRKAYEDIAQGRHERGRSYEQYLPSDKK
jgi:hypothetical protein